MQLLEKKNLLTNGLLWLTTQNKMKIKQNKRIILIETKTHRQYNSSQNDPNIGTNLGDQ